jgi:hypothetical protein
MKIDIEWLTENEPEQRTDLFYCEGYHHSPVCIITGNTRKVLISCDGEMTIRHQHLGQEYVIKDFWDLLDLHITKDIDLNVLDRDKFDDEPWFDAYDITNNYDEVAGHETYDSLDMVHDNLDEVISMVKNYLMKGDFND